MRASVGVGCVVALLQAATMAQPPVQPGDPLSGLTPTEFEAFRFGLEDFLEVETAEEGLGPAYNGTSCAECHSIPAIGRIASVATVRAGMRLADGRFEDFDRAPGSLFQLFSIPTHGCQSVIPAEATVIARLIPIPLFGTGLVEAIPDDAIRAGEDPADRNGDGVSGRAAIIIDRASGETRFGWKAQVATLLEFSGDAYRNEMGITNDLFPEELTFHLTDEQRRECDPIVEPEDISEPGTGLRGIDNFESFMRFLVQPTRGLLTPEALGGDEVFRAIGCASCHVPTLMTGPHENPLFDRRSVPLFSDLLLHDIGTGDGIRQAAADPGEIRTPALWGLRFRRPLLHDGRAATIMDAVLRHGGEARPTMDRVLGIPRRRVEELQRFLESL